MLGIICKKNCKFWNREKVINPGQKSRLTVHEVCSTKQVVTVKLRHISQVHEVVSMTIPEGKKNDHK